MGNSCCKSDDAAGDADKRALLDHAAGPPLVYGANNSRADPSARAASADPRGRGARDAPERVVASQRTASVDYVTGGVVDYGQHPSASSHSRGLSGSAPEHGEVSFGGGVGGGGAGGRAVSAAELAPRASSAEFRGERDRSPSMQEIKQARAVSQAEQTLREADQAVAEAKAALESFGQRERGESEIGAEGGRGTGGAFAAGGADSVGGAGGAATLRDDKAEYKGGTMDDMDAAPGRAGGWAGGVGVDAADVPVLEALERAVVAEEAVVVERSRRVEAEDRLATETEARAKVCRVTPRTTARRRARDSMPSMYSMHRVYSV